MASDDRTNSTPPGEESIEDIVASYVDRLNLGDDIDPEQILSDHPSAGREVLDHLQSFIDFGPSQEESEPLGVLGDYTLRRQIGRGGLPGH